MVVGRELVGRSFLTRFDLDGDPVWTPLENIARLARRSTNLPSFHEAEFSRIGTTRCPAVDTAGTGTSSPPSRRSTCGSSTRSLASCGASLPRRGQWTSPQRGRRMIDD